MIRKTLLTLLFTLSLRSFAFAQSGGILGHWREPGGSIIDVHPCGKNLCAQLISISPKASSQFDIHNPNATQHNHRLCGLVIGRDFHASTPSHAEDGILYDPKTGKTYHGEMTAAGDRLHLRGYVGLRIFGRTEIWTRTQQSVPPCPR